MSRGRGKDDAADPWASFEAFMANMQNESDEGLDIKPWNFPLPPGDDDELHTPVDGRPTTPRSPAKRPNATPSLHHETAPRSPAKRPNASATSLPREPTTPRSPVKRFDPNASTTSLHHEPTGRASPSKSSLKSNTSIKRPVEPATPESSTSRSIKRLREALSPKRPRPSKPSPRSVKTLPPPPPRAEDLDSIVASLAHAQSRSATALAVLQDWRAMYNDETKRSVALAGRVHDLESDKARAEALLKTTQVELEAKRIALKRARITATQEAEALSARLVVAEETMAALRKQLHEAGELARRSTASTDRQVVVIQQELERIQHERVREVERLRMDNELWRRRAEESEFGQTALREGGARLQREVERRDREIEALRKGLARGGRV